MTAGLWVMVPALAMQGVGMGLFQVAYADIVTRTLPRRARGVAGSLAMMTRTLGTVIAASVLMLVFQSAGGDVVAGFRAAFALAAGLAVVTAAGLYWWAPRG